MCIVALFCCGTVVTAFGGESSARRVLMPDDQAHIDQRLFDAIEAKNEDAVIEALDNGANPDARDTDDLAITNMTALMFAAGVGAERIVEILLSAGADVNASDKYGATALYQAALNGKPSIVTRLIAARARVNAIRSDMGNTALFAATPDTVPLLLAAGADPFVIDAFGQTALFHAHPDSIPLLLAAGIDPTVVSKNGFTALHVARFQRASVERLLATHRFSIDTIKNVLGYAQADWPVHQEVVNILEAAIAELSGS
jgi:ankyrin repeat protein